MKITIEIPDSTFANYKKAAELILKNYPFINPVSAGAPRLFEMLIVSDLPDPDKMRPAALAKKFIKAVNRLHKVSLDDQEEDQVDQILKDHPAIPAETKKAA